MAEEEKPIEQTEERAEDPKPRITLPKIKLPKVTLPKIKLPNIKINLPGPAKTIITLFIVGAVSAAALAGVNAFTAERIERLRKAELERAVGSVLPGLSKAEKVNETLFREDGGYAAIVEPVGYGGAIRMVVGVNQEGAVTGVSIVSMAETPGIGTKATAPGFLERFLGKHAGVTIGHGDNAVDAISGATVTSRAITKGVADALAAVNAYTAGLGGAANG
ncbi:hypothetical protein FACS1894208_02760 [Clostridia bacterium]|nr:hypothetical protein FACS1894208_02760 [Clostridia bacterium]